MVRRDRWGNNSVVKEPDVWNLDNKGKGWSCSCVGGMDNLKNHWKWELAFLETLPKFQWFFTFCDHKFLSVSSESFAAFVWKKIYTHIFIEYPGYWERWKSNLQPGGGKNAFSLSDKHKESPQDKIVMEVVTGSPISTALFVFFWRLTQFSFQRPHLHL